MAGFNTYNPNSTTQGDGFTFYNLGPVGLEHSSNVGTDYQDGYATGSGGLNLSGYLSGAKNGSGVGTDRLNSAATELSGVSDNIIGNQNSVRGIGIGLLGQNYSGQVANIGTGLSGFGNDIIGLNANAGGLAGEYVKALSAIDPDRYVSGAAGDVNTSFDTSLGDMERNLARAGISANSGRSKALQQQFAQARAAALAGAKTRARQTGMNERIDALTNATTLGGNLASSGAGILANAGQLNNSTSQTAAGIINNADTTTLNSAQMDFTGQNAAATLAQNDEQFYASLGQTNMAMWLNYFK